MTSSNLATCFAPVLLKPRPGPKLSPSIALKSVKNIAANIATLEMLIDAARTFMVPQPSKVQKHTNLTEETIKRVTSHYKASTQQHSLNKAQARQDGTSLGLGAPVVMVCALPQFVLPSLLLLLLLCSYSHRFSGCRVRLQLCGKYRTHLRRWPLFRRKMASCAQTPLSNVIMKIPM